MLMLNRSPFAFHNELNQLFNTVFDAARPSAAAASVRSTPPMNVWEQDDKYFIEAELPGYTMEQLNVTVNGDEVTIKGERQITTSEGATYLRRERCDASFTRTWTLPAEINADAVEASLQDGVLLITLPKSERALPKRIEVKSARN